MTSESFTERNVCRSQPQDLNSNVQILRIQAMFSCRVSLRAVRQTSVRVRTYATSASVSATRAAAQNASKPPEVLSKKIRSASEELVPQSTPYKHLDVRRITPLIGAEIFGKA